MNNFLEYLINSSLVYYIYNRGSVIYGLNNEESDIDYLVVVDDTFKIPSEYDAYKYENKRIAQLPYNVKYENSDFIFFTTQQ